MSQPACERTNLVLHLLELNESIAAAIFTSTSANFLAATSGWLNSFDFTRSKTSQRASGIVRMTVFAGFNQYSPPASLDLSSCFPSRMALPRGVRVTSFCCSVLSIWIRPYVKASSHIVCLGHVLCHASIASTYVRRRLEIQPRNSIIDGFT